MGKGAANVPKLDLHGFTTDEVFDAIDRFIVNCQNRGAARARIITGKGTGKVKAKAIEYLKTGKFPFQQERGSSGQVNEGVLVVFLDD